MRRSLLGLLTLVAVAGLLLVAGCEFFQQEGVLRVVSINRGVALRSDNMDYGLMPSDDPEDPPYYEAGAALPDSVEVAMQYVEIGNGLPTWTPYGAIITKAQITYKSLLREPWEYENPSEIIHLSQYIPADPTSKKITKFFMTVATGKWKEENFPDHSEPPEFELFDVAEATIKFSGYDSVSKRDVSATGKLTVEFGNIPDGDEFGN